MSTAENNTEICNLSCLESDISQAKKDLMLRFVKDQEALQTSQVDLRTVDDETLDLMDNICVSAINATQLSANRADLQPVRKVSARRSAKSRGNSSNTLISNGDGLNKGKDQPEKHRASAQRGVKMGTVRHPCRLSATNTPPNSRKIHKLSSSPVDNVELVQSDGRVLSGKRTLQSQLFTGDNLGGKTKVNQYKPSGSGTASYVKVQNEGAKSPVKALYRPKSSYMLRHMQSPQPEDIQYGAKRINSAGNQVNTKPEDFSTVLQVTRNSPRNKYSLGRPASRGRNVKLGSYEQTLLERPVEIEPLHSKDLRVLSCTSADSVGAYKLCQKHQLPPITHEASPAPTPPV